MHQPLPDMDEKRQMTCRLVKYIGAHSLRRTFSSLAVEIGLDEKTVRNVFQDHVARLETTTVFSTPTWLGIDEVTLLKKPRCIMTNLQTASVIALLASRNQQAVTQHLLTMPNKQAIEIACMDMWLPYKRAVQVCLPHA